MDSLGELGEALGQIGEVRLLEIADVPLLLDVLVDIADVLDGLLRVVLQGVLHLDQSLVSRIQLSDQELERLIKSLFLLLLEVFLSGASLLLRVADLL